LREQLDRGAAVACHREFFRVAGVISNEESDSLRVELQPWPAKDPVLGRVHDVTDA
jgi:hypothetical protein